MKLDGEFAVSVGDDGAFAVDRLPRRVLSALAGSGEFEAVEEVLGIFRRLETKARVERDGLAMVGHAIARRAVGIEGDNEGDFAIGRRDGNGVWLRRTQKSRYSAHLTNGHLKRYPRPRRRLSKNQRPDLPG